MNVDSAMRHPWRVSPNKAREIQRSLRQDLIVAPLQKPPQVVAGVDVSVKRGQTETAISRAAAVLLSLPGREPLEAATASRPTEFPYVPGLLAFREGPVILDTLEKLRTTPDVLIFDAHGLAHPRRFGLATHLGVLLDVPSVGCAKSRLCGEYRQPEEKRGSWTYLYGDGSHRPREIIGAVVRTRDRVKPVFVSVGHRVDLETAVALILTCASQYRLPETTRWAHRVAGGESIPTANQPTYSGVL